MTDFPAIAAWSPVPNSRHLLALGGIASATALSVDSEHHAFLSICSLDAGSKTGALSTFLIRNLFIFTFKEPSRRYQVKRTSGLSRGQAFQVLDIHLV